mgnify:CR=1 FL=1
MRLPLGGHYENISVEPLIKIYRKNYKKTSGDVIYKAFEVAAKAHEKQVRRSGEPYITHPLAVSMIVAKLGLDEITIAAALLHDCVEDTDVTLADIKKEFGKEIAEIVDGVTKLDRLAFSTKEQQQMATFRKMFVSMAKDIRVIIIKLSDRLHNMRTIASFIPEKQKRIAQETLDIYAPLAHRLGMQEIKWQLEDLSFSAIHPKRYAEVEHLALQANPQLNRTLSKIITDLTKSIQNENISAEISARPKHYWSIYEKMVLKEKAFDEVTDLLGIRIVVNEVKSCYGALGAIHNIWRPVPGRFKDYIASPKFNLYQSLHTTIITGEGDVVEVQIRTQEMHQRAEFGVAAHWGYKDRRRNKAGGNSTDSSSSSASWVQNLAEVDMSDLSDPKEFMNSIKRELVDDDVYVFTPKGKIITLPVNATPVDFAYTVHTEVGHKCIGAKVNGKIVTLSYKLVSGDSIQILTSNDDKAKPSQDWLNFVASSRARAKIKQWFIRSRREDSIEDGEEAIADELRREGMPIKGTMIATNLEKISNDLGQHDVSSMLIAVGDKHISAKLVVEKLAMMLGYKKDQQKPAPIKKTQVDIRDKTAKEVGIFIEGFNDMLVTIPQCCTPLPGDKIVGFITKGRGVSIHRNDCLNAARLSQVSKERLLDAEWEATPSTNFMVAVNVEGLDRSRLLEDIASVMSNNNVNIMSCSSFTTPDRVSKFKFEFELSDLSHLETIISVLKHVEGVYDVYRSKG